jgi:predicted transcriptional regulator of viral defense system
MRTQTAIARLAEWDRQGRYVFLKRDLAKVFDETANNLSQTVKRLTAKGVLVHAARRVYVFAYSHRVGATTVEEVALALRRGEHVAESLESALSQWGLISQVPVDRLTLVTTGPSGEVVTPYGVIEFTHTKRPAAELRDSLVDRPDHPIPIVTAEFALRQLRRVGRNLDLVSEGGSHA